MHAFVELVEIRRQDILVEATQYRLASQAMPDNPAASLRNDVLSSLWHGARAGARTLVANLVIIAHIFAPKGNEQEQTMFTAAR